MKEKPVVQETERYASYWQRCGAYLLDHLITAMLLSPLAAWYLNGLFGERSGIFLLGYSIPVLMAMLVVRCLYLTLLWTKDRGTIGCRLMRISIVSVLGEPLRYARALLRYLGLLAATMLFGLGSLLFLCSRKKQMLQDYVSTTVVVRKQPLSSAAKGGEAEPPIPGK
jgi:uncharacterized RDD family membrane protein YckC